MFGTVSDSKFTRVPVTKGDRIMLNSAGGGGFGDPRRTAARSGGRRRPAGIYFAEAARELYGYVDGDGRGVMAEWRKNDAQWYEERMLLCATSGRMIAKHYLAEEIRDRTRIFATPQDWNSTRTTAGRARRGLPAAGECRRHYADLMVK